MTHTVITSPADIARVLKARRKFMDKTQSDVADYNALSRFTVVDAESGRGDPKLSTLTTLLTALGMTLVAVPKAMVDMIDLPEDVRPENLELGVDDDADWDIGGGD